MEWIAINQVRPKTGPIPRRWRDGRSPREGRERADFRRERGGHKAWRKGKFLKLRFKVGPMHWPPLSLSFLDAVLVLGLDAVRSSFTWLLAIHIVLNNPFQKSGFVARISSRITTVIRVVVTICCRLGSWVDEMDGRWVDLIGKDEDRMERW